MLWVWNRVYLASSKEGAKTIAEKTPVKPMNSKATTKCPKTAALLASEAPSALALVTPPGHPLSEAEDISMSKIAEWPLITWRTGSPASGESFDRYRRERMRFKSVLTLDSLTSVKTYVAVGLGVAMGPKFAIDSWDEARLNVVSLSDIVPDREIGIVTLRDKPLWKSGKLLTDMMHAEVGSSAFLSHFPYGL